MADKQPACVITMVKDDYFFLERWVAYYGGIFGRGALYVVNHGGDQRVSEIAEGCNVIGLPGDFDEKFDMMRWRLFNGLGNGLRGYYEFIIVTDVDEFLVVDPKTDLGLMAFLAKRRGKVTVTPVGVEVVHKPELEPEAIGDGPMLGPRRYARFTSAYSKPVIFNHPVKIARGGHYSTDPELKVFRNLYLFHMRYADAALYCTTVARRADQVAALPVAEEETSISWNWQADAHRGTSYDKVKDLPVVPDFDFAPAIDRMNRSWRLRDPESELYQFDREISQVLKTVPERFFGLI